MICRIRGPNSFAQGSKASFVIFTTMQSMSHPVRRLSPPPDIALEGISQTTLGLPAPRAVKAPGSNQHGSFPLAPRRSCKNQSTVRKFAKHSTSEKVCQLHMCTEVCTLSANILHKSATSGHKVCIIRLVHTWRMQHKSARDADFYHSLHHVCI